MSTNEYMHERQHGVGLIEVMISIIIGMLMVLVIFQIYEVSEGQKRTITAGSDAQQSASYGLYALGRDLSMAGNGISSSPVLDKCAMLRPIPVVIKAGAAAGDPDEITVLYGGSSSLSTPVQFKQTSTTAAAYVVPGPVGFSPNDVIAAVQGTTCTVSTINAAAGSVVVNPATGFATITHTPVAGDIPATYASVSASLVNLGPAGSMRSIVYTVDPTTRALRTRKLLPTIDPSPAPIISEVVNLKAQYGLDLANNGVITWQDATGAWDYAAVTAVPGPPLPTVQQIRAVRIAIITRSTQCDLDPATHQCMVLTPGPLKMFDDTVSWTLNAGEQVYRYKVLETIVPIRNALWNAP